MTDIDRGRENTDSSCVEITTSKNILTMVKSIITKYEIIRRQIMLNRFENGNDLFPSLMTKLQKH